MCGKFTAMASWRQVVRFTQPLTEDPQSDQIAVYRPMSALPVIIFDREAKQRRIVPMRWGFPHPKNPKIPQPIHARAESIHQTKAFAQSSMMLIGPLGWVRRKPRLMKYSPC
jgi:putative SOS response-associated peptidase YedK